MTIVFDGKKFAQEKEKELAKQVAELKKRSGIIPRLVGIMVGEDPASQLYLRVKQKVAERVGIGFEKIQFPSSVDASLLRSNKRAERSLLLDRIKEKNEDPEVSGIMIQLPFPESLKIENWELKILGAIVPSKDVDCLTSENLGRLLIGKPRFLPATVKAVVEIIKSSKSKVKSANVVVVGGSNIVGKPLAMVLSNLGATVTICRSKTKNLGKFTRQAEILISATGVPGLITKNMVQKGAVVIDVGSPKPDVDFEEVKKVARFITPVPGGVGPMTVVCLLENVYEAAICPLI
jgi:methylenetetrahydrofolate dehydrogenase (NADP+)/methenyltetrahydrofolate cyclohydrolase